VYFQRAAKIQGKYYTWRRKAMTKADLIVGISDKLKEPKKTITPIVEEVFNSIERALAKGEK
jgi:HD superfamily phosphohydrolase YqeK